MPDRDFTHVSPGSPLEIQAREWNAIGDMAREFQRHNRGRTDSSPAAIQRVDPQTPATYAIVKWEDEGPSLAEFAVVRYGSPVILPTDNPTSFEVSDLPVWTGSTPTATTDLIMILTEPVAQGAYGRAVTSGQAVVDINITDITHTHGVPIVGNTARLTSATAGQALILYKPAGLGVKRCVVMLDIIGDSSSAATMIDCTPFASLESSSCIQLTVRDTPTGRCADVDPDQTIILSDYEEPDGVWESETQFVTDTDSWDVLFDWPDGDCCPRLRLTNGDDTVTLKYIGCANGKLLFLGHGTILCGADPDEEPCADNSFIVELECVLCPNPDYDGPGYYCVGVSGCTSGHTKECVELTSDPGINTILCSGPHESLGDCNEECETPETITFCGQENIPSVLFFTITGVSGAGVECPLSLIGVTVELTWDAGDSRYEGTVAVDSCGEGGTMTVHLACDTWPNLNPSMTITPFTPGLIATEGLPATVATSANPFYAEGVLQGGGGLGSCCSVAGGEIYFTITE